MSNITIVRVSKQLLSFVETQSLKTFAKGIVEYDDSICFLCLSNTLPFNIKRAIIEISSLSNRNMSPELKRYINETFKITIVVATYINVEDFVKNVAKGDIVKERYPEMNWN